MQNKIPNLSIIVPIYNVEEYLDTCLLSIGKQTYIDFEVIMVDDGSTDNSRIICKSWEQKDNRFHYFYQNNQGLGPARNTGIRMAKSERILFIDSDDWVDDTIVEKLLLKSIETNADIVYGDFCAVYPDGKKIVEPIRNLFQLINATNEERIDYSVQRSLWGAVYKKKLWIENDLFMPDIIYEDTAVYGILLCYAKKIVTLPESLYFYRAHRTGSLMQVGRKDYKNMLRALDYFLKEADRHDLLRQYSKHFFRYCRRQLGIDFRSYSKNMSKNELIQIKSDMEDLLTSYFSDWRELPVSGFIAIGSFSSCEIYNRLVLFRDSLKENYSFTTLESLMSDELPNNCFQFHFDNLYRVEMVKKDLKKTWKKHLDNCKYVLLDLLEERNDIIECRGCYVTKSEAFDEVCQIESDYRIISRKSEECRQLWKEACNAFFDIMEQEHKHVFVLELYLCESKGLRGKESLYENIKEIRTLNEELRYYYRYIKEKYPNVLMISMRQEVFFSSVNYPFGCYPWHYNEMALFRLSEDILKILDVLDCF